MAEIAYDSVDKIYPDGTQAVHDLDLEIGDGELMVLGGPSGCGKTTALRMLAGLEEISDGEIRIGDRVVNDLTPKDRDIAMVFQSYALYPHMTVEQNLAFGLKLRKVPKKEISERVRQVARILKIEEFLKRKPRARAGGGVSGASRRPSWWRSRSRTSTRSSASNCAPRSTSFSAGSG